MCTLYLLVLVRSCYFLFMCMCVALANIVVCSFVTILGVDDCRKAVEYYNKLETVEINEWEIGDE